MNVIDQPTLKIHQTERKRSRGTVIPDIKCP